jgi:two-component system, NarL family, sensor histidine kinase LiaS
MTLSYVWVTAAFVFLLEIFVLILLMLVSSSSMKVITALNVKQVALEYSYEAALHTNGTKLDAHTTFQPGQSGSLTIPKEAVPGAYSIFQANQTNPTAFALLITLDGRVIASSATTRYPMNTKVSHILPEEAHVIMQTLLDGESKETINTQLSGSDITRALEVVWSREHRPLGVIYVQASGPTQLHLLINGFSRTWPTILASSLLLLMITSPIGGLFGLMMTRDLINRLHRLITATTSFAGGNYAQRVRVVRYDEIGQLEQHFNAMAQQLAESTEQQQVLAKQNARVEERARISRELHDAILQDLFSLRMMTNGLQSAIQAGSRATDLKSHVDDVAEITMNMTREMRALLLEMRPPQLEGVPLEDALKELASLYTSRVGIAVTTEIALTALSEKTEHMLLRIVQETLNNAARHANATIITLRLVCQEEVIHLTITDNGQGFRLQDTEKSQGLGLRLIQERVRELHGYFTLDTAPGQGTCLQITLPQETGAST